MTKEKDYQAFLNLVRLGVGREVDSLPVGVDWTAVYDLAAKHGLTGVVLDGINQLKERNEKLKDEFIPKPDLLQWIGEVMQEESQYDLQMKAAREMADLFRRNYIRTYVLKGVVISECYPEPRHRVGGDLDCFLLPVKGDFDAWTLGNDLMKANGYTVEDNFYKHSKFLMPDLMVENHQFMTAFRCNKWLRKMEIFLQGMLWEDKGEDRLEESALLRPPVIVSALFIVEHAYTHFLNEGLSWRHVLDWQMFRERHRGEMDWGVFETLHDEFGLRKFYDSYERLGRYLLGELAFEQLTGRDTRMLKDVWADFDVVENDKNLRGKLSLAVKMLRARWKYRYFSEMSMLHAMWIYVWGYLFVKNPKL